MWDAIGVPVQANSGPLLVLTSLLMALIWAAAAVVFLSPSYIGIVIIALIKVLSLQYAVHIQNSSRVRQWGAFAAGLPHLGWVVMHRCVCGVQSELRHACEILKENNRFNSALFAAAEVWRHC